MHRLIQLEQDAEFDIYFISDIHGQYDLMMDVLSEIGFRFPLYDKGECRVRDRLFILGDLIDRGPKSVAVLGAAQYNPAIVSLIGNHEMMARIGLAGDPQFLALWDYNGGGWREEYDPFHLEDMIDFAAGQPVAITLEIGPHLIGLVHAGVPAPYDWNALVKSLDEKTVSEVDLQFMLWDRSAFGSTAPIVQHVDAVLHGHNILDRLQPKISGNTCYIDAGMAYGDRALILKYQPEGPILGMFQACTLWRDQKTARLNWD